MNRLPRKPARFQPPLRGRAATQPAKRLGPEQPTIAAYRPPARPPSQPLAQAIATSQPIAADEPSTHDKPLVTNDQSPQDQSTLSNDSTVETTGFEKHGQLVRLGILLGVLMILRFLFLLYSDRLSN